MSEGHRVAAHLQNVRNGSRNRQKKYKTSKNAWNACIGIESPEPRAEQPPRARVRYGSSFTKNSALDTKRVSRPSAVGVSKEVCSAPPRSRSSLRASPAGPSRFNAFSEQRYGMLLIELSGTATKFLNLSFFPFEYVLKTSSGTPAGINFQIWLFSVYELM